MENPEEVLQLLEEFVKVKPKDIPRELEEYLGYVAKTGDPVYQWALVKHLFREKLITVITDFYESTLTVELPPCPNVEPFNYERMKTSLLERFDSFTSAPFTVQRICELLTNPKKEYNRGDKYMRAIEKNILVVSTREPGFGKRPLECDSQSETVLNGIPDLRIVTDSGSFMHISTELPFLGAPPASNDVTIETTELNAAVNDRVDHDVELDVSLSSNDDKSWPAEDSNQNEVRKDNPSNSTNCDAELIQSDVSLDSNKPRSDEIIQNVDSDCNVAVSSQIELDKNSSPMPTADNAQSNSSADMITHDSKNVPPISDSIDSSDTLEDCKELQENDKSETGEVVLSSFNDENEVSSTPGDIVDGSPLVQEELDSEAEASDIGVDTNTDATLLPDNEINSSELGLVQPDEKLKSMDAIISEVEDSKSNDNDIDLACNEITGTVDSPVSAEIANESQESDTVILESNEIVEANENTDAHPDSSNDVCLQDTSKLTEEQQTCAEADSMSESNLQQTDSDNLVVKSDGYNLIDHASNLIEVTNIPQVSAEISSQVSSDVSSPNIDRITTEECLPNDIVALSSTSSHEVCLSEDQICNSVGVLSEIPSTEKIDEVQSSSEISYTIRGQENSDVNLIQSMPDDLPDSQQRVEDITIDTNCEAEEEAMDIDDCSSQMLVCEEENDQCDGEPMDQSDQQNS